jgi:putative flippase GtrA
MQSKKYFNNNEITRYIINGLIATVVHFSILTFNIQILQIESAGIANFIAALFGITASFIGSRYYVYKNHTGTFISHIIKFAFLYASIALLHGLVLFIWTDYYHFDYKIGFLLATFIQVVLSYTGNKIWVFNNEN